ncbi:SpoIIAA family protein [Salinimicrobium xinjiangense]|uniref:STAS/SEC14 domain-containing protein n=1 Tax=Salinimicrobium xinjiangense TaxID=438596 RepID=UPI00040C18D8|nr:STAS/SEC14 domain-containing protein [Salinimicrobium xinjiangense]
MLQKIDFQEEHVAGFRWEGKFDEKAFKQSLVQFLPELQMRSRLNIYFEIVNLTEVEAKAIWEEIKFDVRNFTDLQSKIEKVALVTDMSWIRTLSEASSTVVPGISLKAFKFDEVEAAKVWIR